MWSRRSRLFRFVLERQLELGPVDQLPTVTDDNIVLGHLSHSDITDRSPRRGDGLCRCFLPGGSTRSNHIDYPVHAHDDLSFASMEPSIMVAPYGSVDGCPLLPVLGRKQTPGVHDNAWKTDRTSPALEAVDVVVADGQRPLSVRTPTVTSWLTSSGYVLVEAKRIRSASFQPEQLAREYLAVLREAKARAPVLLLILAQTTCQDRSGCVPSIQAMTSSTRRALTSSGRSAFSFRQSSRLCRSEEHTSE